MANYTERVAPIRVTPETRQRLDRMLTRNKGEIKEAFLIRRAITEFLDRHENDVYFGGESIDQTPGD